MKAKLLNGLMFNASWLLIVLSQGALLAWLVATVHVLVHMHFFGKGKAEWLFIMTIAAAGLVIDQLFFVTGILQGAEIATVAPLWLSALWPVLATTAMHAFESLRSRLWLAALFGAFGGYGSYRLGVSLSDIEFGTLQLSGALLALFWALMFPTMLCLAQQFQVTQNGGHRHAPC
jgi:Protein of unknown function (DUF2878)